MLGMGFGSDWNNFLFRVGRQSGKDGMDGRSKGLSRRYKIELGAWSSANPDLQREVLRAGRFNRAYRVVSQRRDASPMCSGNSGFLLLRVFGLGANPISTDSIKAEQPRWLNAAPSQTILSQSC